MKNPYFYNPVIKKSGDGEYNVDIYKFKKGKSVFITSISDKDFKEVLFSVQKAVDMMNLYENQNKCIFKRLFRS